MTDPLKGLEALERVKTAPQYHGERSVYADYTNSATVFDKDIAIIEKYLKLAIIIKEILNNNVHFFEELQEGTIEQLNKYFYSSVDDTTK